MKKNIMLALCAVSVLTLCACGSSDTPAATTDTTGPTATTETTSESTATASPSYSVVLSSVSVAPNMEMTPILNQLGDDYAYYEAPSCAFEGLDKIYTFGHFEISTYPDGDTDLISDVRLLDDMVETPEGICIGSSEDDVIAAYGDNYSTDNGATVYTDESSNTALRFIISDGEVISIEYISTILD